MQIIRSIACITFNVLLILFLSACGGGGGDAPPPPPTATTAAATEISLHTATLNGTVNPHAQATTALFEWGTDNALAAPTLTAAQPIGAGSADNSVSAPLTGLTLGTTYYYRVSATNASGTQKGAIASFTTALPNSPPSVQTNAATSSTISGAVLNGTVGPNELDTTAVFEWGTDSNLTTFTPTSSQSLGAGTTSVAITASLSGLTPGTTYYFRVSAINVAGTQKGLIVSFTADAQPPTVSTNAATSITITGATLNGTVNPNGLAVTDAHFEWGTDSNLATSTNTAVQTLAAGFTGQAITAPLSGLTPGTTYYFRVSAINVAGTQKGLIVSFTADAQPPTVSTNAATSITITGATLNGTVNPNGLAVTDAHFEYGTDSNLATSTNTAVQTLAAGFTGQAITALLTGLTPGTTYYFRVSAINVAGTQKGLIVSFTAVAQAPTVSTATATSITINSATLNGTVNPNGLAVTDAHFEYGTDSNLATSTNTAVQTLAAGFTGQAVTAPLTGLNTGTTYYFRVSATNVAGTLKGLIVSFNAVAQAPTVSTNAATSITINSATLNGTVNPNGLAVTDAHFEYGTDSNLATSTNTAVQTLAAGFTGQAVTAPLTGLNPGTTYYFRVSAINSAGTSKGVIKSFLTGETYVAVGDSITAGSHDDNTADGIGYEPILADLLGVMIANEGVSGTTSADGAASISFTLSNHPSAKYFLIMYGTNDAFIPAVPSGMGLNPLDPGYNGSYKDNMQKIISAVITAGKTPYLAKIPFTTSAWNGIISNSSIQEYNTAIDELRISNGISVFAPDFYTWFQANQSQLADGLHPNGTGYQSMANLWFNVLP